MSKDGWINVRVDDETRDRLAVVAKREDRTVASAIRLAIREYLDRKEQKS